MGWTSYSSPGTSLSSMPLTFFRLSWRLLSHDSLIMNNSQATSTPLSYSSSSLTGFHVSRGILHSLFPSWLFLLRAKVYTFSNPVMMTIDHLLPFPSHMYPVSGRGKASKKSAPALLARAWSQSESWGGGHKIIGSLFVLLQKKYKNEAATINVALRAAIVTEALSYTFWLCVKYCRSHFQTF